MAKQSEDIIIIGAGIAGLAAGCYAQMNGYKTKIFEMHNLPGGLCTSWHRKGYIFDGCIYYMLGTGAGQSYHQVWQELGATHKREFIHHEDIAQIHATDGRRLIAYTDLDQFENHLCNLSPPDQKLIRQFCDGVRTFSDFDLTRLQEKPKKFMRLADWTKLAFEMLPYIGPLSKWGLSSIDQFAQRFHDPFMQRAFPLIFPWSSIPVMVGMSIMAYMNRKNAGFPQGGSLAFAQDIEKRYLELGGEIHYRSQIERILVKDDQAVGIRLYNNDEHHGQRVISACDGRGTIFNLLRGEYTNRRILRIYNGRLPMWSQLQVSLGVDRDLSDEPNCVHYMLEEPRMIAGEMRYSIGTRHYGFDPSLAPEGKSVIIMTMMSAYDYWQRIYGRTIYDHEQIQEADMLIDLLQEFYPGIRDDIELIDVATPLSYERFTGNWHGSICGWLLTPRILPKMVLGMDTTLPGLKRFYMTGQWVEPGGSLPIVAMSGRNIIQHICLEDRKEFTSHIPT